jgi:hypothetical protein
MKYKLILNNKSVTTYKYETELTEEQYQEYLLNPEGFIYEFENDLNWDLISETIDIPDPQYSSSIS